LLFDCSIDILFDERKIKFKYYPLILAAIIHSIPKSDLKMMKNNDNFNCIRPLFKWF